MFKKGSYFYYSLANGSFYFGWGIFSCVLSVYLAGIGCSVTQISLITAAAPLFAIVFQPICGYFADKIESPKKVTIFTAILAIISGFLFAYSKSFLFLFVFSGLSQGALNGMTALNDRMAIGSQHNYGSIRLWGSLFWAIACQLSGIILQYFNPIYIFYIFCIAIGIMLISTIYLYDITPQITTIKKVSTVEVTGYLLKNRSFMMFLIIYILFQGPTSASSIFQPLLMMSVGGTTTLIGTTFLLSTLLEVPVIFYSDRIMHYFSYKQLMIFTSILTIIRYVWYASNPSATLMMVCFFFQAFSSMIFTLVVVRIMMDIIDPQYVNSAYGISSMLAKGLAPLVFQVIGGIILDTFTGSLGFTFVYGGFACSVLVALLLSFKFTYKSI